MAELYRNKSPSIWYSVVIAYIEIHANKYIDKLIKRMAKLKLNVF